MKDKLGSYGLCVVQGVIDQGEVARLQRETWQMVTEMLRDMRDPNTGDDVPFDINNPDSWFAINDIGSFHAYLIKNYGIGQSDVSWQLRRNERVRKLYEILYDTKDLIVSMDSMGIRPGPPREKTKDGKKDSTQGEFKNTSWLHTDQGPARKINTIQSFVSLYDSEPGDPTLHAWPGTHFERLHHDFWEDFTHAQDKKRGDFMKVEEKHLLNPFNERDNPYNFSVIPKNPGEDGDERKQYSKKVNAYAGGADWKDDWSEWYDPRKDPHITGPDTGPIIVNQFEWLMKRGFRPYAFGHTKGSVIMWDSRVFHEGGSPLKENKQSKRIVSYVCYLPLSMQTIDPTITRAEQIAILNDRKELYLRGLPDPRTRGQRVQVLVNDTGNTDNKGLTTSHHPYNYGVNTVRPQGGPIIYNSTKVRALPVRPTVINGPVLELEKRLVYGGDQYLADLRNLTGNDGPPAKRRKVGLSQKRRKRRSRTSIRRSRSTRRRTRRRRSRR